MMDILKSNIADVSKTDLRTNDNRNKKQISSEVKFSEELKNAKKTESIEDKKEVKDIKSENKEDKKEAEDIKSENNKKESEHTEQSINHLEGIDNAINGLNDVFNQMNALNQTDENSKNYVKILEIQDDKDNKLKDNNLIDNNINIPEPHDKFTLPDSANMNFNSNGQPFAEFVKDEKPEKILPSSAKDIAEEQAIMSTMEENVAIANKNMALARTKTVENEHGIQKVDKKSNLVVDTIVSYNNIVMDKSDVDFFTNLVENGFVDMKEVQGAEKSSKVSKVLADLLAKAANDNKPVRIDFDNNISIIIKIDRAGKISADFLPSSQVAEAYLKENLPLLRQRFDDNNIDYNELNQRQRKQQDTQDNKKKGQKNE